MNRTRTMPMAADYVVVGGGAAGCALAARLAARPGTHVLLLEAGPRDSATEIAVPAAFAQLFKGPLDWDLGTEPEPGLGGRSVYWPRGRVLGGSGSMNAQMYVRGMPADFDGWKVPGWTWEDVLPLLRRSEANGRGGSRLRGGSGPQPVTDLRDPNPLVRDLLAAAAEAGVPPVADLNALGTPGAPVEGAAFTQVIQRRGRRVSSARAYLRPAARQHGDRLRVVTGATVTRIVTTGGDRPRATGVEATIDGSPVLVSARREVLLCAGAVGTPHLLLLSGIGPAAELAGTGVRPVADVPEVGRNLQDHLTVMLRADVATPASLLIADRPVHLLRWLLAGRGPLTSNVAEAAAFVRTSPGLDAPDLELLFAPVHFTGEGLTPPAAHGVTVAAVLQQPFSRGRISLRSADPAAKPVIRAGYLSDERDAPPLIAGLRLARRILASPAFAAHRPVEVSPGPAAGDDAALLDHVRTHAHTLYHPCGTCRMGEDPTSVVDPRLRVRGVGGLRVADVSVLPRIVRGHTYAAALLVAERAADLVAEDQP